MFKQLSSTGEIQSISTEGAPADRYNHYAAFFEGKMLILQGKSVGYPLFLEDGGLYDIETDSWTAIKDLPRSVAREEITASTYEQGVLTVSFADKETQYDFTKESWTEPKGIDSGVDWSPISGEQGTLKLSGKFGKRTRPSLEALHLASLSTAGGAVPVARRMECRRRVVTRMSCTSSMVGGFPDRSMLRRCRSSVSVCPCR